MGQIEKTHSFNPEPSNNTNLKTQSKRNLSSLPMNTKSNTVSSDSNLKDVFVDATRNIQDKQLGTFNQVKSEKFSKSQDDKIVTSEFGNLELNEPIENYLSGLSIQEIPINNDLQQIIQTRETGQFKGPSQLGEMGSSWFVGQASEVNNNWLFNHDLKDAARRESKNSIDPSFSMSHAFVLAKEIHPGRIIRAEFILAKSEGQQFQTYIEGTIQHKSIELNYSGLTLLADQKSMSAQSFLGFPLKSHWLGGVSMCFLSGSKLAIGQVENIPVGYRKMNVSLLAGYEKEVLLSKRFSLASGIRLYGGLTNIFKGYENIPSWFNRTHSGNIAWTFSLRYSFNMRSQ
jgi:WD40 repeat protein